MRVATVAAVLQTAPTTFHSPDPCKTVRRTRPAGLRQDLLIIFVDVPDVHSWDCIGDA
jgi:hypothetical protein